MEPIKQEIINNIFENGDKLITGPILQTVLIDMIDDVNVKDQEILSKTGSWDNAVTQIPNLATKEEVTNLSESVARDLENVVGGDLTGYATEQWVESQGYLKEHQDISNLATKTELTTAENNLQGNITSLSESVARDLANVSVPEGVATEAWVQSQDYASKSYVDNAVSSSSVDLTGYATETWVESQGYLTEHQDISGLATKGELNSVSESIQTDISNLATKTELNDTKNNLQGNITSLSESVARDLANVDVDLTGYATETWVQNQGYLKEHQDISNLATKAELTSVSESVQTDIANLSESVTNSAVWKKGTGQDSVVQKLSGDNEANTPTATGYAAVAIGSKTTASGQYSLAEGQNTKALELASHAEGRGTKASGISSHAEGFWTEAPGNDSHAEGGNTEAKGNYSHAEGWYASTTNNYEHAQGQYNHSSTNQIFSVGAGENAKGTVTRRNAVSILAVPNSETQILTSSFFVQNVGGYDGTNPEPGTNDLATVINNLPSGGSSETLWKKGTGKDSIVQVLTGADEAYTPTATGKRAIAIGYHATASGDNSYAEGNSTASGSYSHAEGHGTLASGIASHAEGYYTTASNTSEHAQGRFNHNSENQIFSVGAGEWGDISTPQGNRRNALSVLAVPNPDTKINTASFFVQNIGGYDGTNPEPGTNDLATVINGMSSSGGSSETLWKKGTGTDSIVQVIADGTNLPTATGNRAIAIGRSTEALGDYSYAEGDNVRASGSTCHAEGYWTRASGLASHAEGYSTKALTYYSHAEGDHTLASGESSHAEGHYTSASNNYEHAQGRFNHNSENQIFSIGTGNSNTDRRNAVSVLEVDNSGSYTSSFFVQNVGGYDGTNPTPGTNDLATVINGLSSGGGSSEVIWKKGTGQDSIVQVITGNDEAYPPIATGTGSIATGYFAKASGTYSHAEGYSTKASGEASHAEGYFANASGSYSHAEGYSTTASNYYSHAEGNYANALGHASHAEGYGTDASGPYSHAEGYDTNASKEASHAEGIKTTASGDYSHAEGCLTSTTNRYEHAQGIANHNSTNQIFSVGAGEIDNPYSPDSTSAKTRKNAVSILAVPNSETQVVTASFFVQNIGGYDGTNPEPGTNDLATVLNNTETWTFTLEDGSTVTKNVRIS